MRLVLSLPAPWQPTATGWAREGATLTLAPIGPAAELTPPSDERVTLRDGWPVDLWRSETSVRLLARFHLALEARGTLSSATNLEAAARELLAALAGGFPDWTADGDFASLAELLGG